MGITSALWASITALNSCWTWIENKKYLKNGKWLQEKLLKNEKYGGKSRNKFLKVFWDCWRRNCNYSTISMLSMLSIISMIYKTEFCYKFEMNFLNTSINFKLFFTRSQYFQLISRALWGIYNASHITTIFHIFPQLHDYFHIFYSWFICKTLGLEVLYAL